MLVVLPMMTWQGRNPVDDDGDGRPNQLSAGLPVRLARVFGTPVVPGFAERSQPVLAWLDRERHRYDITTDVALATGVGPQLRGHSGVLVAGDAVWLTERLQRRLRAFVTAAAGRSRRSGSSPSSGSVRLTPRLRLTDPTPPATADIFGARVTPPRAGVFDLTAGTDTIGLFRGTSGQLHRVRGRRGDELARRRAGCCPRPSTPTAPRSSSPSASAAERSSASACRSSRCGSPTDPDVQTLMGRTWDLLSR